VPDRYARPESSSGFIESIDGYAYQPPTAPAAPEMVAPGVHDEFGPEEIEIAPPASAAPLEEMGPTGSAGDLPEAASAPQTGATAEEPAVDPAMEESDADPR
jgi:hypothetical protein